MRKFRIMLASTVALSTVSSQAAIEEIVVTAQKRTESVQDVPISITAFSGDDLVRRGLNDLVEVARYVPNFDMPSSNNLRNVRVRIRGIGSSGTNPGIESSVGTFLDGLYMPTGGMNFGELTDINSVEVLRGPQGTLYGRNTPIGALNVTTRKPGDEFESLVRLGYGEYDQVNVSGYVGGGLSDSAAGRLSFWYRDRDGFEKNTFTGDDVNDNEEWGLRGKLLFAPTDTVEINTMPFTTARSSGAAVWQSNCGRTIPTWGIATPGFLASPGRGRIPIHQL